MDVNGNDQRQDGVSMETSHTVLIREAPENCSGMGHDENLASNSRCSSQAWSEIERPAAKLQGDTDKFRGLERRSSFENFGHFGFLVPALALVPGADGADALTQQFGALQGKHRELKLAAAHIDDALTGRGCYGKARSFFKPRYAKRCFDILNNAWFRRLMIINVICHSLLAFFEPPSISVVSVSPAVCVLDLICIVLYIFDITINITFLTWPVFWSRKAEARAWNGVQFVLVCLFIFDYIVMMSAIAVQKDIPQIFRCLRLAVVLCKAKNIRHIFMVLITIGFKLSKVFSVIFVFVWVFSCTSLYLFMDIYQCHNVANSSLQVNSYQGQEISCTVTDKEKVYNGTFNQIGLGMLRLFVLLSTENYPEVMLPAIRVQGYYFLFFAFYVFVGVFFLTAIVLAVVVDSYWVFAKKHVKKERGRERAELAKAWNLLDPLGLGALSVDDEKFIELFRLLKPKNTDAENMMLIEMLDTNEDGEVDSFEWTTMLNQVLGYEFENSNNVPITDKSQRWFKCLFRLREGAVYVTETFPRFVLVLIIIHCILFAFKWQGQTDREELVLQVFKSVIITIFLLESLMRFLVLGKKFIQPLELMDAALVVIAFCTNMMWYAVESPDLPALRSYSTVVSCLAVFFRLPFNNTQFKRAIEVFIRVAPVMVDLMCILFIILYIFAVVGMELFHGAPASSNDNIYLDQCGLGFETFWCASLVLFQMVTTSNWHEIMNSVMESTQTYWSSLYFVLAYILVNMVVMNLFVAIAIEAFNKLATLDEMHNPSLARHGSDQRPVTAKTFVKKQAVKMLNNFASNVFGSTRAKQVAGRRQSSTFKRSSVTVLRTNGTVQEKDEKTEDEKEEDFKGDKRERKLKKRMKQKKKTKKNLSYTGQKVRVIAAFRGGNEADLDLTVGDEVTLIQKTDNWWQGHCKNKVGWFPASHVVMGTIKAVPDYRRRDKQSEVEEPRESAVASDKVFELKREKTQGPSYGDEHSFYRERSSAAGNQPLGTPPSVRGRIKMKKTGDWRRNILGEMTVMNAEEMRELNNIMRAELRSPLGRPRSTKLSALSRDSGDSIREAFQEDVEYEMGQGSRPASARSVEPRPYSGRYHVPGSPKLNAVEPYGRPPRILPQIKPAFEFVAPGSPTSPLRTAEQVANDEKRLKVLGAPPKIDKSKIKEKTKDGEMPEWIMKFVQEKQVTVGDDVKFDDTTNAKDKRKSSSASPRTGTWTGTDTGSGTKSSTGTGTLKTGTGNAKSRSTGSIPGDVRAGRRGSSPSPRKKSSTRPGSVPAKVIVHRPATPRTGNRKM